METISISNITIATADPTSVLAIKLYFKMPLESPNVYAYKQINILTALTIFKYGRT